MPPSDNAAAERHVFELEARFRAEQRRMRRRAIVLRLALNVLGVLIVLGLWEAAPRIVPDLNDVLMPPPSIVFETMLPMLTSGEIAKNIWMSLRRAGGGFLLAALGGILVGFFTARAELFNALTEPILHGCRSLPAIALVPLSVLWFGIGEGAKIALVCWGAFFPIWVSTHIGVRDVHRFSCARHLAWAPTGCKPCGWSYCPPRCR